MRLPGVELVAHAGPHDFGGIGDRSGSVEALPERIADEGARRRVVATDPGMDVSDQLPTLGNGNAALQNTRGTALFQLVDQDKRLGPPSDAPRLSAIRG